MSAMQRIHVRTTIVVDRATADVLRIEAKKVAMFEHDTFEDYLDYHPEAQHGLALRYRDIFDLIDALGWNPTTTDPAKRTFKVPLTEDLINLLGLRHEDLMRTVDDRLAEHHDPIPPEVQEEITTHRLAAVALHRIFHTYARTAPTP